MRPAGLEVQAWPGPARGPPGPLPSLVITILEEKLWNAGFAEHFRMQSHISPMAQSVRVALGRIYSQCGTSKGGRCSVRQESCKANCQNFLLRSASRHQLRLHAELAILSPRVSTILIQLTRIYVKYLWCLLHHIGVR